jgi:lysophospholipase L1-like esterase
VPPAKTALAIATCCALLVLPGLVPALSGVKLYDWRNIAEVWDLPLPKVPGAADPAVVDQARASWLRAQAATNLTDPAHQLDHLYEALRQGREIRVIHYGDSPTTADLVTGDVRALLQHQFGDGGSGFTLIAKPWAWYNHRGVEMSAGDWQIDIAGSSSLRDGFFGLGGVSFRGETGAVAQWKLKDGQHRSAEVAYLAQPEGGEFTFEADGVEAAAIDTSGEKAQPAYARFDLPPGSKQFTLRVSRGAVRLFGVEFRKGPGLVYSSLGVNGASVTMLSHAFNASHWTKQLQHYHPDLVVLAYGTNESGYPDFVEHTWGAELTTAVRRIRAALPDASILLMSPMDRGSRNQAGEIETIAELPRLIRIESRVAEETGVAFFNTFQSMGGAGTMARWYSTEPRLVGADLIHPMPAGAKIVGELLYRALRDGFSRYKLRQLTESAERAAATGTSPRSSADLLESQR